MAAVPRHVFVEEALASRAYEDTALPIGLGQTISQPWVVAKMTEAVLDGGNPEKLLEVGTGSGYQAYVLEKLGRLEGLPKSCFAIIAKYHHAAIDGASGSQLVDGLHSFNSSEIKAGSICLPMRGISRTTKLRTR